MADAHRRRFDAVIVRKFDTFARSVSHLLCAPETFRALGIDFVSYSEQMDTSTPARCCLRSWGAVAELGRSLIVERVKAGLRNAKAKGNFLAALGPPGCSQDCHTTQERRVLCHDRPRNRGCLPGCVPPGSGGRSRGSIVSIFLYFRMCNEVKTKPLRRLLTR
jgi:hypothetical protein